MVRRLPHVIAAAIAIVALAPAGAQAVTYNVTTTTDEVPAAGACIPGDQHCSLREAIIAANTAPSDDVVVVPRGTYVLTQMGLVAPPPDDAAHGDLDVIANGKLAIQGSGARFTRIHADRKDRVLDVQQKADVTLSGLTLTGGDDPTPNPTPPTPLFQGGGLRIDGAGASPVATVTAIGVSISSNHADRGGGVTVTNDGSLVLVASTVGRNVAEQSGGGIENVAGCGGCTATTTISNSTVSTNSQTHAQDATPLLFGGGGIASTDSVVLRHATVASNTAKVHGGGIQRLAGTVDSKDSIVSENKAASTTEANCSSPITSSGFNVERGTTCGLTQSSDINGDPVLGPLASNGGGTDTQFPGVGSKAVDTADSGACPATDQRAVSRPRGAGCDRGSVEAEATDLAISMTDSPDPIQSNDTLTYSITVRNLGSEIAHGVVIKDPLPAGVQQGTSSPGGTCSDTHTEVCTLGNIPAGGVEAVTIRVQANQAGTLSNTATVSSAGVDTNPSNNSVTRTTTVTLRPGACANLKVGTAAGETINGTSKGDLLRGLAGPDRLFGGAGADCLEGGNGNDELYGGSANDKLSGGAGGDFVKGGSGKDTLNGGQNNDTISAADGQRDTIDCGQGGNDHALVDTHDSVKNCEVVTVQG